jgi:hypothetical protein
VADRPRGRYPPQPGLHQSERRHQSLEEGGQSFAIERAGQTLYPQYIFDELWNPRPVVATILKVFDGYSPFRIAAWFESTNGMLNSQRPREIIASNPEAVVEAALDERQGAVHG